MINFINKICLFFFNKDNKNQNNNLSNKMYNVDKINKQKLYEKWCKKEKWLLHSQGILLLLSIDPSKNNILDNDIIKRINDLKDHANQCVKKNLLSVIDVDKPKNCWEVKPIDLYRWATISRIDIPDEFNVLMSFITQIINVNSEDSSAIDFRNSENKLSKLENEIILGATTSLLINSPEICRDNEGNFDCKVIVNKIIESKKYWFRNSTPKLSESDMVELIEKYVRMSKVLY